MELNSRSKVQRMQSIEAREEKKATTKNFQVGFYFFGSWHD
jgi:hypothetical protein